MRGRFVMTCSWSQWSVSKELDLNQMEGIQGPGVQTAWLVSGQGRSKRPPVLCDPRAHRGLFLTLSICELLKWPETKKRVPGGYKFRVVDFNRKAQMCTEQRGSRGPHSSVALTAIDLSKAVKEPPRACLLPPEAISATSLSCSHCLSRTVLLFFP